MTFLLLNYTFQRVCQRHMLRMAQPASGDITSNRTRASVGSMNENLISSTGSDIYFLTSLGTAYE